MVPNINACLHMGLSAFRKEVAKSTVGQCIMVSLLCELWNIGRLFRQCRCVLIDVATACTAKPQRFIAYRILVISIFVGIYCLTLKEMSIQLCDEAIHG